MSAGVFQVMPDLTPDELAALEADIAERGVVVPVVLDQHGRVLDGHHRRAIADRLGLPCPVETREVADDEDARQTALALNLARRHLTREQRRDLIARECQARPGDSDRAIARRVGCSPSTVAAVRRPASNLDTPLSDEERRELIQLEDGIQQALDTFDSTLVSLPPPVALRLLREAWRGLEAAHPDDEEFLSPLRRALFEPRLDALLAVLT
ncbi:MAG: helix-turn-helix domain-containing protein [Actinomycetota bacterium]|nr:helix-turn-helix domain-containing protein [Actinomycetota bacterium]